MPEPLDDKLCFALYAASRAVTQLQRPMLDELGLTYPQYLVMVVLWEKRSLPVKDLAAALQLDYGTVSPLLKRLEAAGLLRRERRADDERSVLVALTDGGAALRARAEDVPGAVLCAMDLDDDEYHALLRAVQKLTESVSAPGAASRGRTPAAAATP
ncbi:MarR family winged helix-turn-helix transcriptional regulator [Umezawaea beigongshangensis]|uniref:MarR family winged helix-turn-helix transcriptional regulator n=1 Tax=Umezawaea beigongshangensis TaxID=2780383 RepID=UPI0018F123C7|nr:MarR family transcriptional regulator [Umezawaea beigongshangensis]